MEQIVIFAALGYLLGSIPFGLVLSKLAGYGDIRSIGSGNIGATNVLRTGNKKLALLTLILDGGKGAAAVLLAKTFGTYDAAIFSGLLSILGHTYPVWLKFKGGKGVATTLGMMLALTPVAGVIACLSWLAAAFIFRVSSLSALIAMALAPLAAWFVSGGDLMLTGAYAGIAALIYWKHRTNIQRLLKGEEPKIGKSKDKDKTNEAPSSTGTE